MTLHGWKLRIVITCEQTGWFGNVWRYKPGTGEVRWECMYRAPNLEILQAKLSYLGYQEDCRDSDTHH